MGVAELIVAICLQAEPAACRVYHHREQAALTGCAIVDEADDLAIQPGWYLARWTCRWKG